LHYPINVINLSLMEKSREIDQLSSVEDNILNSIPEYLATGEYRFEDDGSSVHVVICKVDFGQSITVKTSNSEEDNSTIISIERLPNSNKRMVTAIQTKMFKDASDRDPIYLLYFPDSNKESRYMKNCIGLPNLARVIQLAIKAQESIE